MIGRVAGAPIIVTPSSALFALVLAMIFVPSVEARAPGLSVGTAYGVGLCFAVLLLLSILIHELAHGLVATARGLQVREFALTLIGGHTAFGGGRTTAGSAALIAAVGPVANLGLAVLFGLGATWAPDRGMVDLVLYAAAYANGFVGLFNLVPGLPLDGGQVLESVIWAVTGDRRKGTIAAAWCGRALTVAFVIVIIGLPLARGGRPELFSVVWSVMVASFLWSGASQALRGAQSARQVDDLAVTEIGIAAVGVAGDATLADADLARQYSGARAVVLLSPDLRPAAYVDESAASQVPSPDRPRVPVTAVAIGLPAGAMVDADLTGAQLYTAIATVSAFAPVMVAVRDGQVVALVRSADVAARLRT